MKKKKSQDAVTSKVGRTGNIVTAEGGQSTRAGRTVKLTERARNGK